MAKTTLRRQLVDTTTFTRRSIAPSGPIGVIPDTGISPGPPPLEAAVLAWIAAAKAVEREAYRIADGGIIDQARLTELHAVVEDARQRCELLAVGVLAVMDAKESSR